MAQQISLLGIDIAKLVFHVVGMNESGHVVLRKRIARSALLHFIATLPPALIGMEACGSAHYWAQRFHEHGHDVRLIAPQFMKAYVKSPKNDTRDAEAICEAVTRPTMRFVPIKQVEQQDLQALHRVRERLIKACTALVNEIRGLLSEDGIVLPQGMSKFRTSVVRQLEAEQAKLTPLSTEVFWQLYDEFLALGKQVAYYNEKLQAMGQTHRQCQRLQAIPGLGPLMATAILAAVPVVSLQPAGNSNGPIRIRLHYVNQLPLASQIRGPEPGAALFTCLRARLAHSSPRSSPSPAAYTLRGCGHGGTRNSSTSCNVQT